MYIKIYLCAAILYFTLKLTLKHTKENMTISISILLLVILVPFVVGMLANCVPSQYGSSRSRQENRQPPTLLFHSVTDNGSLEQSHITTARLNRFLSYLHDQKYRALTVSEIVQQAENSDTNSSRSVALIFDDGFENFYLNALPLFDCYTMKATIFPVAGSLDSCSLWDTYKPQKQLTKKQVNLLADAGHEIGSHTLSHPDLVLLSDKELYRELSESKKILEDCTGRPVTSLSFPFGSWNARVWSCAQECGYIAAVAYRKHRQVKPPIIPATAAYAFDTVEDIIEKIEGARWFSNALTRRIIMPHFAKGTPVWRFRKTYDIFNYFRN